MNRLSGFHAKVSRSEKRENVFARKNIGLKTPSGLQFENRCHLLAHKIPLSDEEEQNLWYSHIIFDICRYQLYSIYHYCFTFIRKAIKIAVKKSVLWVFTKSDLFGITPNAVQENTILEKMRQLGFEKIPQSGKIDQEKIKTRH